MMNGVPGRHPSWGWREYGPSTSFPGCLDPGFHAGGFSLLEVLVVMVVIGLLLAIALPVMSAARRSADIARCGSNQRQLGMVAGLYAADYTGHLGQADALDYRQGSDINNGKDLPARFIQMGMNHPLTRQADHYLAWGYLPPTADAQGRPGHETLRCPGVARQHAGLSPRYWKDVGNVQTHYFFSTLLHRPTTFGPYRRIRNNTWGPYRSNQVHRPQDTFLAGDAVAMTDLAGSHPAAMVDRFNWESVGEMSTIFGVTATLASVWTQNPPPYHRGGPNGLYFDGHVAQVLPPSAGERYKLRPNFTADFSGECRP